MTTTKSTTTPPTLLSLPDEILAGVVCYLPASDHRDFFWSAKRFATRSFVRRVIQNADSFVLCNPISTLTRVLAVSPDSKLCIVRERYHWSSIWSLETGECLKKLRRDTTCAVFCLDSKRVIVGSTPTRLEVFESGSDDVVRWSIPTLMEGKTLCDVDVLPDGKRAVIASEYGKIRVWDIESGVCERTFDVNTRFVYYKDDFYVIPLPDGLHVACMNASYLSVSNLETGEMGRYTGVVDIDMDDVYDTISRRKFRPSTDGRKLRVVLRKSREIREYDLVTGDWVGVWEEGDAFRSVDRTTTPDGRCAIEWYVSEWSVGEEEQTQTRSATEELVALPIDVSCSVWLREAVVEVIRLEKSHND